MKKKIFVSSLILSILFCSNVNSKSLFNNDNHSVSNNYVEKFYDIDENIFENSTEIRDSNIGDYHINSVNYSKHSSSSGKELLYITLSITNIGDKVLRPFNDLSCVAFQHGHNLHPLPMLEEFTIKDLSPKEVMFITYLYELQDETNSDIIVNAVNDTSKFILTSVEISELY